MNAGGMNGRKESRKSVTRFAAISGRRSHVTEEEVKSRVASLVTRNKASTLRQLEGHP